MAGLDVNKSSEAFRTIGEAADIIGVAQHVLRFWESKFRQLRPVKRRGRRYYKPEDLELLKRIKTLLYEEGFTIKGVQKFLKNGSVIVNDKDVVERSRKTEEVAAIIDNAKDSISPEAKHVDPAPVNVDVAKDPNQIAITRSDLQDIVDDLILVRDELKDVLHDSDVQTLPEQSVSEVVTDENTQVTFFSGKGMPISSKCEVQTIDAPGFMDAQLDDNSKSAADAETTDVSRERTAELA